MLADPVAALDELGRILDLKGRVLPMCPLALQIEADVAGLESDPRMFRVIRGQVAVATTVGQVRRVRLLPGDPPATRQAVDAIMAADLVVLGPGSWFTSVIPHVLVPGLASALNATTARRALVLNLVAEPGETAGFSAERHIHVLAPARAGFQVDDIIVDAARVPSRPGARTTGTDGHPARRQCGACCAYPDLVHSYTTRRCWLQRWKECACAGREPAAHPMRSATDRTTDNERTEGDESWR